MMSDHSYVNDGVLYVENAYLADALRYEEIPRMMLEQYIESGKIVGVDA